MHDPAPSGQRLALPKCLCGRQPEVHAARRKEAPPQGRHAHAFRHLRATVRIEFACGVRVRGKVRVRVRVRVRGGVKD